MIGECAWCAKPIKDNDTTYFKSDMSYAHAKCADKLYECSKCSCYVHRPVYMEIDGESVCSDCS